MTQQQLAFTPARQAMLKDAVVEAGRQLMAAELRLERAPRREEDPDRWEDLYAVVNDAWQTLRDACHQERVARAGR